MWTLAPWNRGFQPFASTSCNDRDLAQPMPVGDVALDDVLARFIDGHDRTSTTAWQPSLGSLETPMHECPHCGSAVARDSDQLLTVRRDPRAPRRLSPLHLYLWIRGNDIPFVRLPERPHPLLRGSPEQVDQEPFTPGAQVVRHAVVVTPSTGRARVVGAAAPACSRIRSKVMDSNSRRPGQGRAGPLCMTSACTPGIRTPAPGWAIPVRSESVHTRATSDFGGCHEV